MPVSQTISGNSLNSVTVSTPCTLVPAGGSCNFTITIQPTANDYLLSGGIQDTVSVNYSGRLPAKISSLISTTVQIPALSSLTVTPSAISYSSIPTTLGNGFVTYTATATTTTGVVIDVTPIASWTSSNTSAVSAPNTSGQATTYFVGGAANNGANQSTITATLGGVSESSTLQVNDMLYQAVPYGGTGGYPYGTNSPIFYNVLNASTGAPSGRALISDYESGILYTTISSDARFIYMSNDTNAIYACGLDASTGDSNSSTTCPQITLTSSSPTNDIGTLKLSPNNKFLYALTASGIYVCQANQVTGAISGCILQSTNISGGNTLSFAVDQNGEYIYVVAKANVSPYIQTCEINQDTGALSNCVNQSPTGLDTTLTTKDIAAANASDGTTYLYGSSYLAGGAWDGTILVCQANPNTGTVSTCNYPATSVTTYNPQSVSVATTRSGATFGPAWLYWADQQHGDINYCEINSDYISFGTCGRISTGANNFGILVR